jgi:predicted RNA binding protein YcfA (HicA-like mRNA interferase family)
LATHITSGKLIKTLTDAGFVEVARKGSHVLLQHPDHKQRIALPISSPKKDLPMGIVRTILKVVIEAGIISKQELERTLLRK